MALPFIVGVSSASPAYASDPQGVTVPVPTGTQVGDLLCVGFWAAAEVTDTRLTQVDTFGSSPVFARAAYGEATYLADVTLTFHGTAPRIAFVVSVRNGMQWIDTDSVFGGFEGDFDNTIYITGDKAGGVVVIAGVGYDTTPTTDPFTGLYDLAAASADTSTPGLGATLRVAAWMDGAPTPASELTTATGSLKYRAVFPMRYFVPGGRYLRQRQSPRRTPSRVRGVDLRQRQTPFIR